MRYAWTIGERGHLVHAIDHVTQRTWGSIRTLCGRDLVSTRPGIGTYCPRCLSRAPDDVAAWRAKHAEDIPRATAWLQEHFPALEIRQTECQPETHRWEVTAGVERDERWRPDIRLDWDPSTGYLGRAHDLDTALTDAWERAVRDVERALASCRRLRGPAMDAEIERMMR